MLLPPMDIPVGQFTIVADPQGAVFTTSAVPGGPPWPGQVLMVVQVPFTSDEARTCGSASTGTVTRCSGNSRASATTTCGQGR